jgi:two-component sensor histidine kinase
MGDDNSEAVIMSVVLPSPLASYAHPCPQHPDMQADFRQLRHQTKNTLATIMLRVSQCLETGGCHNLAAEVERRIMLAARISNALFGLTQAPGPFAGRLRSLCDSMVGLLGDPTQEIETVVDVQPGVPANLETLLLRAAHELVGNAIKHGLHMRLIGCIEVAVTSDADGTVLVVSDDGWDYERSFLPGEGLQIVGVLAQPFGGQVSLRRCGDRTLATLRVPGP